MGLVLEPGVHWYVVLVFSFSTMVLLQVFFSTNFQYNISGIILFTFVLHEGFLNRLRKILSGESFLNIVLANLYDANRCNNPGNFFSLGKLIIM